jgi:UDPglucose 6-dehydrogenase
MNITVMGTGYVGLVAGACLADFGCQVICVDIDESKIAKLNKGIIPIYEPGLEDVVKKNYVEKRLRFSIDIENAVKNSEVVFVAVGTPPGKDGEADLSYVFTVAENIGRYINKYTVIVNKSTVPIGTGQKVKKIIKNQLALRKEAIEYDVVSNPEFLREGSAVYDFVHTDRVVIGAESEKAIETMKNVYRSLYINETPFVITNIETAEMIKYAANAFLAVKITYINEIANLCEKVGADVHVVSKSMGMDGRISSKFLHPGPGYGGSCFPKDTKAIVSIAKAYDVKVSLIEQTIKANDRQKVLMVQKILSRMGDVNGKTIAVLGLAFKQNTDDMREAPSLVIIPELINKGAKIKAFDPECTENAKTEFADFCGDIVYCKDEYEACESADALVIVTEWNQFRNLDIAAIKETMKGMYFFDLRNLYERNIVEKIGFIYEGVGR